MTARTTRRAIAGLPILLLGGSWAVVSAATPAQANHGSYCGTQTSNPALHGHDGNHGPGHYRSKFLSSRVTTSYTIHKYEEQFLLDSGAWTSAGNHVYERAC